MGRDQELTRLKQELAATREQLERTSRELNDYRERVQRLTHQLMESNQALAVLARNLELAREEAARLLVQRIKGAVLPLLERLRGDPRLKPYQTELGLLVRELEDLSWSLAQDSHFSAVLTATEMRIASMVKNGMTSREIAQQLNISIDTVKTHRRNIRRKLKLTGSGQNLRAFLIALEREMG